VDLNFHPFYNNSPVFCRVVLKAAPQITDILNPITRALDYESMSYLSMPVDEE